MSAPIPDFMLERLRLGELEPVAAARLRDRMGPEDEARLAAMDADDARLLDELPPRVLVAEVEQRLAAKRRPRLWLAVPILAVAAAVAVFALRAPPVQVAATAEAPETTRAKGDDRLLIFRRTAEGEELLDDGDGARAGDLLQLALSLTAERHAVVMSVDGRGAITAHFPVRGEATAVDAGRHALDHAFALDDAPRYERFVLVTAEEPIDLDTVRGALAEAGDGSLDLPAGWWQDTVTIRKETP